jgi:thiol-disulfide isomerase/thioredoxin
MGYIDDASSYVRTLGSKNIFLFLFVAALFIAAAVYTYSTYVKPRLNAVYVPNKEFNTKGDESEFAELYFFYTDWCPHCKTAKPIMAKLQDYLASQDNTVNGVSINYIAVNCEEDKQTAERFNVEGYPTIKLVSGNKVIEYDAKPDLDILKQFLSTSLQH